MNPVMGGAVLHSASLQQPSAVAYTGSSVDATSLTRFDTAMATGPSSAINGISGVDVTSNVSHAANVSSVSTTVMAQSAAAPLPANGVDAVSGVSTTNDSVRADAVDVPNPVTPAQAPDPASGIGDRILASLRNVSNSAAHTWSAMGQLGASAGGEDMSVAHLLTIQMGAMQASVQFDYVGKIISRSTQNIDTLIKTQ